MKSKKKNRKRILPPYLFLLPFILIYIVTFLFPAAYSLVLSFFKYRGYGEATFVGLSNYESLLTYRTMWKCLGNTLFYFQLYSDNGDCLPSGSDHAFQNCKKVPELL